MIFWGARPGCVPPTCAVVLYAPPGKTPVVQPNHRRIGLGLISAVSNRGELRRMVLDGAIKAPVLIRFLQRLIRDAMRKVFMILYRLRVHRSAAVREWLAGTGPRSRSPTRRPTARSWIRR